MKKIVIRFNAPVILTFALLSLLALLLGNWTGGTATTQFFSVYRSSLADPLTYVRFFGHVLGHTGYEHYMGNMLLLLLVGPGLEEKYGSGTMVWMIALTALVTGLVHFIFFPHSALLGASGVVFMMIVLSSFTAARRGEIPVTLILVVIFYLGGEIMDGLFKQDNVHRSPTSWAACAVWCSASPSAGDGGERRVYSHRHRSGAAGRRPGAEIPLPHGEAPSGEQIPAPDPSGKPRLLSGAGAKA